MLANVQIGVNVYESVPVSFNLREPLCICMNLFECVIFRANLYESVLIYKIIGIHYPLPSALAKYPETDYGEELFVFRVHFFSFPGYV